MIQRDNPTLHVGAGPVSVAFSENPVLVHACDSITEHQLPKSCWKNRLVNEACGKKPDHSALQKQKP